MRAPRASHTVAAALALALAVALRASAAAAAPSDARVVELLVLAGEDERPRTEQSVSAPLVRLGVAVRREATGAGFLARVVVDVRPGVDPAVVTVWDGASGRELVRREVRRDGSTEVTAEQIALIVEATMQTRLAMTPSPAAPSPAEAREPPAPRAEPRPSSLGLELGAALAATSFARDAGWVLGPALSAGLVARAAPLHPSLWAEARTYEPVEGSSTSVDVRVRPTSLRLGASVELLSAGRLALGASLQAGVDVASSQTSAAAPSAPVTPRGVHVSPIVGVGLGARVALWRRLQLSLGGALDLDTTPHTWTSVRGGEHEVLVEASRLRPVLQLGLVWTPTGAAPYAPDTESESLP